MRPAEALPLRLLLLLLVACAIFSPILHHHDSTGPEARCAVCHSVASPAALTSLATVVFILPRVKFWKLPSSPDGGHISPCLAACGLRAPPASL